MKQILVFSAICITLKVFGTIQSNWTKTISGNSEKFTLRPSTASENLQRSILKDYVHKSARINIKEANNYFTDYMMSYYGNIQFDPDKVNGNFLRCSTVSPREFIVENNEQNQIPVKPLPFSSHKNCIHEMVPFNPAKVKKIKPRSVCLVKYGKRKFRPQIWNPKKEPYQEIKFTYDNEPLLATKNARAWRTVEFDTKIIDVYKEILKKSVKNMKQTKHFNLIK